MLLPVSLLGVIVVVSVVVGVVVGIVGIGIMDKI